MTAILLSVLIPCIMSPVAAQDVKTVKLTVTVKDEKDKPIQAARVGVYQTHLTRARLGIPAPADYQDTTNAQGIASFDIRVKTGERLKLFVEVAREDMQTGKDEVDLGTDSNTVLMEYPMHFTLKARASEGGDIINVGVKVLNDDSDFVEGANVLIRAFGERYSGTTDRDGKVVIPVQFTLKKTYTIEVSKQGYKPGKGFIELDNKWGRQTGKTVFAGNITIEKGAAAVGVAVTVSVKDQENSNKAVAEAVVVLDSISSAGYYSSTTDELGTATFLVTETGGFAVRISQDYYEPLPKTEVRLLAGETSRSFDFTLKAKPKSDGGRDTIDVTVLANDPGDEKSKPKPLPGALVKIGIGSAATDSSGRVTLSGTFIERQEVTADANGYKSQTKFVSVSRLVAFSVGTGSTTFILEPELSESSPVRLIVEVRDATGNKIKDVNVDFYSITGRLLHGGSTKDKGETDFRSSDAPDVPLSVLRQGLTLRIKRDGYKEAGPSVPAKLLEPSLEAHRFYVQLDKSWDDLRKAIDALEPRVLAWNNDVAAAGKDSDLARKLAEQAPQSKERVAALLREIEFAGKAATGVNGISAISLQCRAAASLKSNIQSYKAEAATKEQALKASLNSASALAGNCSSVKDGEAVKRMYREAIQLTGAIGALEKKAVKDGNELKKLANENNDLKKIIAEVEKKVAEIRQEMSNAEQAAATVGPAFARSESLTKSLPGRRDALTGELARLKAAHGLDKYVEGLPSDLDRRVEVMTQLLGRQNNNAFGGPSLDWPKKVQEVAREIQLDYLEAVKYLRDYKRGADGNCDVEAMDGVVQEIGTMVTNSSFELGLAADLPNKAQACINKGKCQPIINDARALFERYSIEEAAARINEARTQGCDVSGLDEELDYWKTLRDAVVYLKVRQQRCEFREAYEWSLNIPASIRNRPLMKETLANVYNGLKAQERIGQLRRTAKAEVARTNQVSSAEPFIRQAEQIAGPYPCLVEEVSTFRNEYPATGKTDQNPTDEVPGALGENKAKKENPTDEIPTALGGLTRPLGGSRPPFPPPGETKPGSKTKETPTDEVPGALGSEKGRPPVRDDSGRRPGGSTGGSNTSGSGGTSTSSKGSGGGGSGGRTNNPGERPCTADERTAFSKMTGSFKSYRMNITIGGSCEQASGTWKVTEWCEGVDTTYNSSIARVNGTLTGRMQGGSLEVNYQSPPSPNNSKGTKGTGSCSLNGDGTFSCSFSCENKFKTQ